MPSMTERQKIAAALNIAGQRILNASDPAIALDHMIHCLTGGDVAWKYGTVETTGDPTPQYKEFHAEIERMRAKRAAKAAEGQTP